MAREISATRQIVPTLPPGPKSQSWRSGPAHQRYLLSVHEDRSIDGSQLCHPRLLLLLLLETKAVVDHRLRLCMHINRDNRGSPGAAYRAGVEPRRGGRSERPRGERATQRVEGWKETGSDTEDRDHGGLERVWERGRVWCSRAETLHANGAHLS